MSRYFLTFVLLTVILVSTGSAQFNWTRYENNPVLRDGGGNPLSGYSPTVMFESGVYKMWYSSLSGGINYDTSPDGIHWGVSPATVFTPAVGESQVRDPKVIKMDTTYVMYYSSEGTYRAGNRAFAICMATSSDGIVWSRYAGNPVLTPAGASWDGSDIMNPKVVFDGSMYRMWYSAFQNNVYQDAHGKIGLATSPDGFHWSRYVANPILVPTPNAWDSLGVLFPDVVSVGDNFFMIYLGYPAFGPSQQFGVATSSNGVDWAKSELNPVAKTATGSWDEILHNTATIVQGGTVKIWYSAMRPNSNYQFQIGYASAPLDTEKFNGAFEADTNTVALWHFNEGSGTVLHDASPNHLDADISNGTWVNGLFGQALRFNGTSSMVSLPMSDILRPGKEFTIEGWFKPDTLYFGDPGTVGGIGAALISCIGLYPNGGGYELALFNDGLEVSYRAGDPIYEPSRRIPLPAAHRYYNIKMTYQSVGAPGEVPSTGLKTFLDGVLVDSAAFHSQIQYNATPTFYIGTDIDGRAAGSSYVREFPGTIDEVRISKIARTVPVNYVPPVHHWPSVAFHLSATGGSQTDLTLGAYPGATAGIDSALGELELPPLPPAGNFDARWLIASTNGSLKNLQDTLGSLHTSNVYRGSVQTPDDAHAVLMEWDNTILPPGTFILQDATTHGNAYSVNLKSASHFTFSDTADLSFEIVYTADLSYVVSVVSQWNMLSVPVVTEHPDAASVFPDAASKPYRYDHGYAAMDSVMPGVGYWVKYTASKTLAVHGTQVYSLTIPLSPGWNLIGTIGSDIAVGAIQVSPLDLQRSPLYAYSGGYFTADTLRPGRAYWVKANVEGSLILSSGPANETASKFMTRKK